MGEVKFLERTVSAGGGSPYVMKERIVTTRQARHGYMIASLMVGKKRKTLYVHRLVASAFIPNPDGKEEVNHIDGNKQNNAVTNLEWVTPRENSLHSLRNELRVVPSGDAHYKRKHVIKQKQDEFYKLVARALQVARQQRRMSIADLSNASGEQHKTIKGIESGTAQISMHHAVWMKNILGLDLNAIIRDMEGNNGKGNTVNEGTVFRIENFI